MPDRTPSVADASTGSPPLVPPFLEVMISDGLNAASPVSVALAAYFCPGLHGL